MKKVAVVILNWNGAAMLRQYLPQVLEYSRDEADVYVADNASTDNSLDLLRTSFPEVKLIVLEQNWGFAEGYNKALSQIDTEYYLLLNSDIEVTPHWLTPLISFMDTHPPVAACQPNCSATSPPLTLSMLVPAVVILTDMAIPIAGVGCLTWLKRTKDSMIPRLRFTGQRVQPFLYARVYIKRWVDLTDASLLIRKRLICVGVCVFVAIRFIACLRVWSIMWVVEHYLSRIP